MPAGSHRAETLFLATSAAAMSAHSRHTIGYLLNEAPAVPVQSIVWLTQGPPWTSVFCSICFLDAFIGHCTFNMPETAESCSAHISHLRSWQPPPSSCPGQNPQSPRGHFLFYATCSTRMQFLSALSSVWPRNAVAASPPHPTTVSFLQSCPDPPSFQPFPPKNIQLLWPELF